MLPILRKIFILILIFICNNLYAQSDSSEAETDNLIDNLYEESSDETDNSDMYDFFEDLIKNPVDLNKAGSGDFQRIPYLNLIEINLIIKHREKYGKFFSKQELYSVEGLSGNKVAEILPFLTVDQNKKSISGKKQGGDIISEYFNKTSLQIRNRISKDLQTRKGFLENKFEGSPYKVYNRVLLKYNHQIQLGGLIEKDAGEKPLNEFSSFHFALKDLGMVKNLVIGDYGLEFGQGLALWGSYGFSKGSNAVFPVKKNGRGVIPYISTNENNFFRGMAATVSIESFNVSAFYSQNKFDANIDPISKEILSMPADGYHRTETEIAKRKAASEKLAGANLDFSIEEFMRTGISAYHTYFSNPLQINSINNIENQSFNFYSIYYNFYLSSVNIFGETALDGKHTATVGGIELIVKNFSYIISIRNYSKNFINLHGYGFGESSGSTQNEFGIYNGIRWIMKIGEVNFYYDQFKYPYSTYTNPLPSGGNEFMFNLKSAPFNSVKIRLRYKYENKDVCADIGNTLSITKRLKQSFRFEVIHKISRVIKLKERLELSYFNLAEIESKEKGLLVFQEIKTSLFKSLDLTGRIIFFKTDSFNSAIYESESGISGIFSNLAMYGQGIRWYVTLKYQTPFNFALSCKYSETYKPDEKYLSSGYSQINGNLDNNFILEIDTRL